MGTVKFRTADGKVVSFKTKKNPIRGGSKAKQRRGGIAALVDAQDRRRSAAKRSTKRKSSKSGCRTVKFKRGPRVQFCGEAGSDKARKRRLGKKLAKQNNLKKYAFVKGKALTDPKALKGKRNAQVFTRGGKTYRMISYRHPSTGKQVRYALRVKATAK